MPTYDYTCQDCGHRLEHFQSITADPLSDCPQCGRPALQRLLGTGGGLIFKGSGFYITDYRSDSYQKAVKAESGGDGAATTAKNAAPQSGSAGAGGATSAAAAARSSNGAAPSGGPGGSKPAAA